MCRDDACERVVNDLGDCRAVVAEPFGAGIIVAQQRDGDAARVHRRELGLHAEIRRRHLAQPVAHLEKRGAIALIDERVHFALSHQVDDFGKKEVALAIHESGRQAGGGLWFVSGERYRGQGGAKSGGGQESAAAERFCVHSVLGCEIHR